MARPIPTPPTASAAEVVTPLQRLLTGTLLLAFVLCPLLAFSLYLSPLYKAPGALYRGDYFMIGLGAGLALSVAGAFVWMAYLPGLLERRETRKVERAAERREADRKAREELKDRAARRDQGEEE